MSEKDPKKAEAPADAEKKKGGGGAAMAIGIVLPALLAGGAAFAGAKIAVAKASHGAAAGAHGGDHAAPATPPEPPGPTLTLEPFLMVTMDAQRRAHPMRVAIAVEFTTATPQESTAAFTPRIRDAALVYLRALTYENATNTERMEHMRTDLLRSFREAGAATAQRVLVTDLVVQ
jgi:flagellar basal body-associated protein FliL